MKQKEVKNPFEPVELSAASTEQLLDANDDDDDEEGVDLPDKSAYGHFTTIQIDADDEASATDAEDDQGEGSVENLNSLEVNFLLQEQRRYARQILTTFYAMAFCIFVYTIAHTAALIFIHFCGS